MITLPEAWIVRRYLRLLARVVRAARAHVRWSYPDVVQRPNRAIGMAVPDPDTAADWEIGAYLIKIGETVVAARNQCNSLLDSDGQPFQLVDSEQPGVALAVSPGCEAAFSLLDAVDRNIGDMLMAWQQETWCAPRDLYDRLRDHELRYESGLARFTGFLEPVEVVAPAAW